VAAEARTITDEAARTQEQAVRTGEQLVRGHLETAHEAVQTGLQAAATGLEGLTDTITKAWGFDGERAREAAQQSSENLKAVSEATTILARGAQDASREWLGRAQDRVKANVEAMSRLAGCRSTQDFFAVQSELMRETLRQAVEGAHSIAEVSLRSMDEATRVIVAQPTPTRQSRV